MTGQPTLFDLDAPITLSAATRVPEKFMLPDLPDRVHGIKSMSPCIVQCDGCGKTATRAKVALTVLTSRIVFNPHVPGVRQCSQCWARDGWAQD